MEASAFSVKVSLGLSDFAYISVELDYAVEATNTNLFSFFFATNTFVQPDFTIQLSKKLFEL